MPMRATRNSLLCVEFDAENSITFKMHENAGMDFVRWLKGEYLKLSLISKRAERIEKSAIDLKPDDRAGFNRLAEEVKMVRNQADELSLQVAYVKGAAIGWTDYYEDEAAEARGEPLPFDDANIARIGMVKLNHVINKCNVYYGLDKAEETGKQKGESLPEPSPSEIAVESSRTGTASLTQTVS